MSKSVPSTGSPRKCPPAARPSVSSTTSRPAVPSSAAATSTARLLPTSTTSATGGLRVHPDLRAQVGQHLGQPVEAVEQLGGEEAVVDQPLHLRVGEGFDQDAAALADPEPRGGELPLQAAGVVDALLLEDPLVLRLGCRIGDQPHRH